MLQFIRSLLIEVTSRSQLSQLPEFQAAMANGYAFKNCIINISEKYQISQDRTILLEVQVNKLWHLKTNTGTPNADITRLISRLLSVILHYEDKSYESNCHVDWTTYSTGS